mmetsp:Transcript_17679/g.53200  ORF Transcript_17679/g.53200 Transcript_17679/m.53200 type:complete len:224 (-) Transcript_17679:327-998(-)
MTCGYCVGAAASGSDAVVLTSAAGQPPELRCAAAAGTKAALPGRRVERTTWDACRGGRTPGSEVVLPADGYRATGSYGGVGRNDAKVAEELAKGLPPQEAAVGDASAADRPRRNTGDAGSDELCGDWTPTLSEGASAPGRDPGDGDHMSYRPAAGTHPTASAAPVPTKPGAPGAGAWLAAGPRRARMPGASAWAGGQGSNDSGPAPGTRGGTASCPERAPPGE